MSPAILYTAQRKFIFLMHWRGANAPRRKEELLNRKKKKTVIM